MRGSGRVAGDVLEQNRHVLRGMRRMEGTAMARAAVRPDEMRKHNLGLLLDQVHRDGALSRAELTGRVGLNRSTIRSLVTDLSDRGVLCELAPVGSQRAGRPSRLVGPRSDGPYAIAVDVEVGRVMTAAVGLTGQLLNWCETGVQKGERTPEHVADVIVTHVDSLTRRARPGAWAVGVGVCVPGTVSGDGRDVVLAPNLGWRDVPFGAIVAEALMRHRIAEDTG